MSGLMPQLRIARGFDPVDASRGRGDEYVVRPAEAAPDLGARKQRGKLRFGARGKQREPVERAGKHAVINELGTAVAEPAVELEARLLEAAMKAHAAARAVRRIVGEALD